MKNFIPLMILMIALFVALPSGNEAQASNPSDQTITVVDNQNAKPTALALVEAGLVPEVAIKDTPIPELVEGGNFFSNNWGALLLGILGFAELVTRITPTEKDNSIVNFLLSLFNSVIPNLRKGGGSFRLLSR